MNERELSVQNKILRSWMKREKIDDTYYESTLNITIKQSFHVHNFHKYFQCFYYPPILFCQEKQMR